MPTNQGWRKALPKTKSGNEGAGLENIATKDRTILLPIGRMDITFG